MLNIFEVFLPQLLRYPNPTDPLNGDAAVMLLRHPEDYEIKVREHVAQYASKEAAQGSLGGHDSDMDEDISSVDSFSDDETAGMEL
jgi:ubiquitin-conjugating enzyme E2 H